MARAGRKAVWLAKADNPVVQGSQVSRADTAAAFPTLFATCRKMNLALTQAVLISYSRVFTVVHSCPVRRERRFLTSLFWYRARTGLLFREAPTPVSCPLSPPNC